MEEPNRFSAFSGTVKTFYSGLNDEAIESSIKKSLKVEMDSDGEITQEGDEALKK